MKKFWRKPIPPEGTVVLKKLTFMDKVFCVTMLLVVFLPLMTFVLGGFVKEKEIVLDESFKPKFVKVEFDLEEGTMYVKLRPGEIYETREITVIDKYVLEDAVMLDFSKDGKLIGVEVIRSSLK